MLLILIQRVEFVYINDILNKINLYIVPKLIMDERRIKPLFVKEWNSTHKKIRYTRPVLVGNYNIKRSDYNKIIKNDILLHSNFDYNIFEHWSFKDIESDVNNFSKDKLIENVLNTSQDINLRLQLILKPFEMNNLIGWDSIIEKYLVKQKKYYYIRKMNIIYEED